MYKNKVLYPASVVFGGLYTAGFFSLVYCTQFSQDRCSIYPLTDIAMLSRSSKFHAAGTSCIKSYRLIQMMLGYVDNKYDVTNGVTVTLVPWDISKIKHRLSIFCETFRRKYSFEIISWWQRAFSVHFYRWQKTADGHNVLFDWLKMI